MLVKRPKGTIAAADVLWATGAGRTSEPGVVSYQMRSRSRAWEWPLINPRVQRAIRVASRTRRSARTRCNRSVDMDVLSASEPTHAWTDSAWRGAPTRRTRGAGGCPGRRGRVPKSCQKSTLAPEASKTSLANEDARGSWFRSSDPLGFHADDRPAGHARAARLPPAPDWQRGPTSDRLRLVDRGQRSFQRGAVLLLQPHQHRAAAGRDRGGQAPRRSQGHRQEGARESGFRGQRGGRGAPRQSGASVGRVFGRCRRVRAHGTHAGRFREGSRSARRRITGQLRMHARAHRGVRAHGFDHRKHCMRARARRSVGREPDRPARAARRGAPRRRRLCAHARDRADAASARAAPRSEHGRMIPTPKRFATTGRGLELVTGRRPAILPGAAGRARSPIRGHGPSSLRFAQIVMLLALADPARAAMAPSDSAFLQRYAATQRFTLGRPTAIQVTPASDAFLFLRSGPRRQQRDLYVYDVKSRTEKVLVTADKLLNGVEERLTPEERASRERRRLTARGIASFELSRDGTRVLVPLSGRLFVVDRAAGTWKELKSTAGAADAARFSPDGEQVSCVRDGDLYAIDVDSGEEL